jgi:hypothetical protein
MNPPESKLFIQELIDFFSDERDLKEVVDHFGIPRNSLDADVVALRPKEGEQSISAAQVWADQSTRPAKAVAISFSFKEGFGLTHDILQSLFPSFTDEKTDNGGTEAIRTYHSQTSHIKRVVIRSYGSLDSGEINGISCDLD